MEEFITEHVKKNKKKREVRQIIEVLKSNDDKEVRGSEDLDLFAKLKNRIGLTLSKETEKPSEDDDLSTNRIRTPLERTSTKLDNITDNDRKKTARKLSEVLKTYKRMSSIATPIKTRDIGMIPVKI